jgi:hypothetical protein
MMQSNIRMSLINVGFPLIGIALLFAAASISYASSVGRGELTGTVTDVRTKDDRVVFWVNIEEQRTTGLSVSSPATLLYKGEMISDIKPGIKLHVKFDSDNEVTRDTGVLYVESIEFPDGRVIQGESFDAMWKWSEVLYGIGAGLLLLTGAIYFHKRPRSHQNR